jgi:hypothetical protein
MHLYSDLVCPNLEYPHPDGRDPAHLWLTPHEVRTLRL